MRKYARETSVGFFVCICLLCVAYLTVRLGKMELLGSDTYTLTAKFTATGGLKSGADVVIAGVPVGKVAAIGLDRDYSTAVASLKIRKDVALSKDAIATIKTSGLIGDKYISLSQGGSSETLKDGDLIAETQSSVDLEQLIGKYAFGDVK